MWVHRNHFISNGMERLTIIRKSAIKSLLDNATNYLIGCVIQKRIFWLDLWGHRTTCRKNFYCTFSSFWVRCTKSHINSIFTLHIHQFTIYFTRWLAIRVPRDPVKFSCFLFMAFSVHFCDLIGDAIMRQTFVYVNAGLVSLHAVSSMFHMSVSC